MTTALQNPAVVLALTGFALGLALVTAFPRPRPSAYPDNPQAWRPIRCEACSAIVHGRDCAECGAPLGRKHQSDYRPAVRVQERDDR